MSPKPSIEDYIQLAVEQKKIPRYLYRYRSFNSEMFKNLKAHSLWFSDFESFNDPFDGRLVFPSTYSEDEYRQYLSSIQPTSQSQPEWFSFVTNGVQYMGEFIENELKKAKQNTRICCFSQLYNNILMWSHYSDSHKGLCLEFDVLEDKSFFYYPLKVDYTRQYRQSNYLIDQGGTVDNMIKSKSIDWKYEKEIRVIKPNSTVNIIQYNPKALKSIIFGCKASMDNIQRTKKILGKSVQYKQCVLDDKKYRIRIVRMK